MTWCATCQSFGWVPWDRRFGTTASVSKVRLLVRCACNRDGQHPIPSERAVEVIMAGRDL